MRNESSRLTFRHYGTVYSVEEIPCDASAQELIEIFTRMLVQAGFSPEVIQIRDGGRYRCEYIEEE